MSDFKKLVSEQFKNSTNVLSTFALAVVFSAWAFLTRHHAIGMYMIVLSSFIAFFSRREFTLFKLIDAFIFVCTIFFLLGISYTVFAFGIYSGSQNRSAGLAVTACATFVAYALFKIKGTIKKRNGD